MKKQWIEVLRTISTLTVVLLHILMTIIDNNSVAEIGKINFITVEILQIMCRFAVPIFIMITGSLLLNPSKQVNIKKYIIRIIIILLMFGVFYSFLELFFDYRTINLKLIFLSILNTLEGKSWAHMWYLYMLIGLYLITPMIKVIINNNSSKELFKIILILSAGNIVINTINYVLNIEIENFMLVSVYVVYYLMGYYLIIPNNKIINNKEKYVYITGIISLIFLISINIYNIICNDSNLLWTQCYDNIFLFFYSIIIFIFIKNKFENYNKEKKIITFLSKYSFCIYLVHPFFINFIYKVLKFTPMSLGNIELGILIMFIMVVSLSIILSMILKKIPYLKKLV